MKIKSIFISDIHLGCGYSLSKELADLLCNIPNTPDNVFLVGDIFDGWKLKNNNWKWNSNDSRVIRSLLQISEAGSKIVYVVGNHDEFLLSHINDYGFVDIRSEHIYCSGNKKYMIIHGDYFDAIIKNSRILGLIGDYGYAFVLNINYIIQKVCKLFNYHSHWSFSKMIKQNVKKVCTFISNFDSVATAYAKQNGCNGLICGHIHTPHVKIDPEFAYFNCGDWVENGTMLIEYEDGSMKLLDYSQIGWNKECNTC